MKAIKLEAIATRLAHCSVLRYSSELEDFREEAEEPMTSGFAGNAMAVCDEASPSSPPKVEQDCGHIVHLCSLGSAETLHLQKQVKTKKKEKIEKERRVYQWLWRKNLRSDRAITGQEFLEQLAKACLWKRLETNMRARRWWMSG